MKFSVKLITVVIFLTCSIRSYASDCNRGRLPENGDWVSYIVYSNKEKLELKLAIVGEEKDGDKKALWFEMVIRSKEIDFIIKRLVVGDPFNPEEVLRQIVKIVNKSRPDYSPALEVPIDTSYKAENTLKSFPCIEEMGEKIQYKFKRMNVTAFAFKSDRPRSFIIYSRDIPFFGIIKAESENAKIELLDIGRNASSEITEEPIKLIKPENLSK